MAVIIPKELLDETGVKECDRIKLSLAIPTSHRDSALEAIAGLDKGKRAFERDKRERNLIAHR